LDKFYLLAGCREILLQTHLVRRIPGVRRADDCMMPSRQKTSGKLI
jgi:hypothetical protein